MADETTTSEAEGAESVERPPVSAIPQSAAAITERGIAERRQEQEAQAPELDPETWWGALGEEGQKLREGKKWSDPMELLKAHQEATKRLSQRDEEREALASELEEYRRYYEEQEAQVSGQAQQPQVSQPGGVAPLDFDALATQLIDPNTGEMNPGRMLEVAAVAGARMAYEASLARMDERFAKFEQERVQPLVQQAEIDRMSDELKTVERLYGADIYETLGARIEKEMEQNAQFLEQFGGVRGAFAEMAFRSQQEEAEAKAKAADGFTLTGGGRRPQQAKLSPEEAELAMMETRWRRIDDGF